MATAGKNSCVILLDRSDFHIVNNSPYLSYVYVDINFSRWDVAAKVYEMVF